LRALTTHLHRSPLASSSSKRLRIFPEAAFTFSGMNGSRLRHARIVCVCANTMSFRGATDVDFEAGHTDRNTVTKEKTNDVQRQNKESFFAGCYFSMMMTG
jgi:hypothetical protein